MSHRLLVLGSMGEFVQLVKKAKERNYYVVVCDGYESGPAKKYADASYNIHVDNVEKIVSICKEEHIDGIIGSFSDLLFERITEIAEAADLRWYVRTDSLKYYREKDKAKQLMHSLGIGVPDYTTLDRSFKDDQLEKLKFPLVIKPIDGYGSKGVYVVHSVAEIRDKFDEVAAKFDNKRIIAEEYACGHEYNMMAWLIDGILHVISVADRDRNPQTGNEVALLNRVVYPSKTIHEVIGQASDVLQKFANATGQKEGPLSMQFFYDDNSITVCEIAGRLFGYEHELVSYCSGLDIEELLLDYVYDPHEMKKRINEHSAFSDKICAGLYFVADHGEIVSDLSVAKDLKNNPYVIDSILFYSEGERVDNYSSRPYFARYYIGADNRNELDEVTKYFFSKMSVKSKNKDNIVRRLQLEE